MGSNGLHVRAFSKYKAMIMLHVCVSLISPLACSHIEDSFDMMCYIWAISRFLSKSVKFRQFLATDSQFIRNSPSLSAGINRKVYVVYSCT